MEPAFVVVIILIVALVAVGVSHQRDLKKQQADKRARLMPTENEGERQDLQLDVLKLDAESTETSGTMAGDGHRTARLWVSGIGGVLLTVIMVGASGGYVAYPKRLLLPMVFFAVLIYLGITLVYVLRRSWGKSGKYIARGAWRRVAKKLSDLEQDGR